MPLGLIERGARADPLLRRRAQRRRDARDPSAWREMGVGVHGSLDHDGDGLRHRHRHRLQSRQNGDAAEGPGSPLAATHQEGALASAGNLLASRRAALSRRPGLRVGSGVFTGNASQRNGLFRSGNSAIDLAGIRGRITLWDLHAVWQPGLWDLRALYARGSIGQAKEINDVLSGPAVGQVGGFVPKAFDGWFVQAHLRTVAQRRLHAEAVRALRALQHAARDRRRLRRRSPIRCSTSAC